MANSVIVLLTLCVCIWDLRNASGGETLCKNSEDCTTDEICIDTRCVNRCHFTTQIQRSCVPPFCRDTSPFDNATKTCMCNSNDQCWEGYICVNQKCVAPCVNRCGANANCHLINGFPNCACIHGHTGNPVTGCKPQGKVPGLWPPATGRKTYHAITDIKLKWLDACLHCMRNNMRLARIESKEENDDILKVISKTKPQKSSFWIDGTDHGDEGNWYWMTTSKKIDSYSNWANHRPNNLGDKEHCLSYHECKNNGVYMWDDRNCWLRLPFVCEDYE